MNADQARRAAEFARGSESDTLQRLQDIIDEETGMVRRKIGRRITEAVTLGNTLCTYTYIERISASRTSREGIEFIEGVAKIVAANVVKDLQIDGYNVETAETETRDYRDEIGAPAEYFDTTFHIDWHPQPSQVAT